MSKKEAYELLLEIANALGTMGIEHYSCKDAEEVRKAINLLYYGGGYERE